MKKIIYLFTSGLIGTGIVMACTQSNTNANTEGQTTAEVTETATATTADKDIDVSGWPETSQKAAKAMMEKYGHPTEHTASMLIWNNTGPFTRTIVYMQEIDHDFPMPHKDVLEQYVNYKVPVDKYDDLAMFDGSVICERTKGEMSARCDKEGANLLALNLANDIVKGKRSVDDARKMYGKTIMEMMEGKMPEYMKTLTFESGKSTMGDPDKTTMDMSKVKMMKSKM